jgi:hypothetical protein
MTKAAELRPADDAASIRACFPVMQQLRPHLASADELVARWQRQRETGYRIVASWIGGKVVALVGCRKTSFTADSSMSMIW